MLRSHLDLIHPDAECSVNTSQGLQKANYDKKANVVRFVIGQHTMAMNFRDGPTWLPGAVVEQLGVLTFLVQLGKGPVLEASFKSVALP